MKLDCQAKTCSRHRAKLLESAFSGAGVSPVRFDSHRRYAPATIVAAFTLTELLVVIAILALLAATQLPALTGGKAPVGLTQCMNNLRQIGQATQLYTTDNYDRYPIQAHLGDPADPGSWTKQVLRYLGNNTDQPAVYRCPSEVRTTAYGVFPVHYVANRYVIVEDMDLVNPISSSQIKRPSLYWLFIERNPDDSYLNIRSIPLRAYLDSWNSPPGYLGLRRHNGGFAAAACDGHVECLRAPPYQPGRPPPQNFGELGDISNGQNPASSWVDNGLPKKLYCRKFQNSGAISF